MAEADELVTLAKRQQLTLQVGHVERFNPGLTSLEGKLEDPKFIEARRCSGYTFRSTDIGVVLDLMIHDIDVVLNLVQSSVTRVEALGSRSSAKKRTWSTRGCTSPRVVWRISLLRESATSQNAACK